MGNEQKQENLNNQNIQEQEPKQMMPYVDNQDMKERATRFGTGGFAAIIYAVVTTICLYKNAYGIMTVLFAAATIGFLYYVCSHAPQSKAYDNREDKTSNPHTMIYYIGILLLGVSTFLTADRFLITCNYIGIYLLSMTVFFTCFCDADKWGVGKYIRAVLGAVFSPLGYLFRGFSDCYVYVKLQEKKKSKAIYVLVGVLIALPFLVLMLIVLSEADAIFKYIVDRSIGNLQLSGNLAGFVMMLVAVFVIVYGIFCKMVIQPPKIDCEEKRMVEPMIGITFCGLLTALYAVFAIIQILSPFLGKQMLPAGILPVAFCCGCKFGNCSGLQPCICRKPGASDDSYDHVWLYLCDDRLFGSADVDVHSGISSDVSACAGAVWTAGIGCAFHWHDHLSV